MGDGFIHAVRRSERAAADERNFAQLQKPLDCAIFAVFAVEYGEHTVNLNHIEPDFAIDDNAADAAVGRNKRGLIKRVALSTAVPDFLNGAGEQVPSAVLRNADA